MQFKAGDRVQLVSPRLRGRRGCGTVVLATQSGYCLIDWDGGRIDSHGVLDTRFSFHQGELARVEA